MTVRLHVSVLIPTFNRGRLIADTIDAVLGQTRPPDEVLVIDDGSTDDTAEVVARYAGQVSYVRQNNAGKAVALNRGLAAITGDAVWICDDDDIPLPGTLERFSTLLEQRPELDFVFGLHDELIESGGDWVVRSAPAPRRYQEPLAIQVLRSCFIFQPGMLVRRRCYQRVGNFDERLLRSQDYDMLIRLAHECGGAELDGVVFHQRVHSGVRGPAHEQTSAVERRGQWLKYDRMIFAKVGELYRPDEFGEGRIGAVRRAAIMARRGLWNEAATALSRALEDSRPLTQEEKRELATVFDWAGYGLLAVDESWPFFNVLAAWSPRVAMQAAWALARPLGRRFRSALRRRDREQLRQITQAATALFRMLPQSAGGRQ